MTLDERIEVLILLRKITPSECTFAVWNFLCKVEEEISTLENKIKEAKSLIKEIDYQTAKKTSKREL